MSNWLSGLRRFGLSLVTGCAALIASSGLTHAQSFAVTNLTNNTASTSSFPDMVVDAKGNSYLALADSVKGIVVFTQFDGVKFNTQFTVPGSAAAVPAFQPQMAIYLNAGPTPIIGLTWAAVHPGSNPTSYDVYASRLDPGQTNFSLPTLVSAITGPVPLAGSPRLAFDTTGMTNVVWGRNGVWISQAQDGIHFGAPISLVPLSTSIDTGGPRIAVTPPGHIFVVWTDEQAKNQAGSYCTAPTQDASGTFTNTVGGNFWVNETLPSAVVGVSVNISAANTRNISNTDWLNGGGLDNRFPKGFFGCSYDNLNLFLDQLGGLHFLWSDDSPDEDVLTVEAHGTYQAGSPFAGQTLFSFPINLASHAAASPKVAADASGNFYFVWSGGPGPGAPTNSVGIFFRRFDVATDTFTAEINLVPSGSIAPAFPQIATDSSSNVNVAWEQPTKALAGDGSDVFNVFFARSTDRGTTFPTVVQVTTNPSVLCYQAPPPPQGTGAPPTTPDVTTCGTVQLGVNANSGPDLAWVNQASGSAVADIDFATSTSPTGTITPNAASLTASSSPANFTITVNGFSSPITFSCLDADKNAALPSWLGCSFNPPTLNPAQGNTDTLTITRQATPTSGMFISAPSAHNPPAFGRSMARSMTLATLSLMAMLMLAIGRRRDLSRAILMRGFLVMTLTVVLAAGLVSCGGGTSKSTSGTTGSTGGAGGGGSTVTMHVAVKAQSGGSTTTLGTVTITAQ